MIDFKRFSTKLPSKQNLIICLVLALTVWFSLGKTLQYYFYMDDYALLYHLQHNYSYGCPYDYVVTFFIPFFKIFGLWAESYFMLGIISYFLASLILYFFLKILTKNKLIALLSSLIFATAYIGLDQFTMMSISTINNLNIVNVLLTLLFFTKWVDTKELKYYFATIALFWFSIAAFPFRAYPLILFLPTLGVILSIKIESLKKIFSTGSFIILRTLPFILIGYFYGIFSYGAKCDANVVVPRFTMMKGISNIFTIDFIKEFFTILGKLFLDPAVTFFKFIPTNDLYFKLGIFIFIATTIISSFFIFSKKYSRLGRSLLIALFLTVEGYIGNMLLLPTFDSNGAVNRYLTVAFIGYSAILPIFIYLLIDKISQLTRIKKLSILIPVLVVPLIIILSSSSRKYEQEIITGRSLPARKFYNLLLKYLPSIQGKNIFYFDHADYQPVANQFGLIIFGAFMPREVTLAVPYKVAIDQIKIIDDFNLLVKAIKDEEVDRNRFHAFYYDENGLNHSTKKFLSLLEKGEKKEAVPDKSQYDSQITSVEVPTSNVSSLTPGVINLDLKAAPYSDSFFNFPFYGSNTDNEDEKSKIRNFYKSGKVNKSLIFAYLLSRKKYYEKVKVEVSSSHVGGNNQGERSIDDNKETSWLSNDNDWQIDIKPWIRINLEETREINRLAWIRLKDRVLTNYQISYSADGISWQEIKDRQTSVDSEERVIEEFPPILARFIMIKIGETKNNFPPGLAEIEAVEYDYKDVDIATALKIKENPFEYIEDAKDLIKTYDYLESAAVLKILTKTNKDETILNRYFLKMPIILDNQYHNYQVSLPARGTDLEKIRLELNFPAIAEIGRIEIISPPLKELKL